MQKKIKGEEGPQYPDLFNLKLSLQVYRQDGEERKGLHGVACTPGPKRSY